MVTRHVRSIREWYTNARGEACRTRSCAERCSRNDERITLSFRVLHPFHSAFYTLAGQCFAPCSSHESCRANPAAKPPRRSPARWASVWRLGLRIRGLATEEIAQREGIATSDALLAFLASGTAQQLFGDSLKLWWNGPSTVADQYEREKRNRTSGEAGC